ncbi:MAG: CvpA family protein [Rhodocyclaceae bacterium]|nr:CvpA family protein [Rhodocyclaceae bacterium]
MAWFDIAVLAVLGVSVLLGVMRGIVKETMAIISWVVAFLIARQFARTVSSWLPATLQPESLRYAAGFAAVLLGALLLLWIATFFASQLVSAAGFGGADRGLGALFGFARGVLIVVVAVLLAGLTELPKQPGWRNAWLSAPFESLAESLRLYVPAAVRGGMGNRTGAAGR